MSEFTTRQILDMIKENRGPNGLDLSDCDLRGIDLSWETVGIGLMSINLRGANLRGANLRGAILVDAHLEEADLQEANLDEVKLQRAHLEQANLTGAHLQDANLRKAGFEGAKLESAHLEDANLLEANLDQAFLREAHLDRGTLSGAHLDKVNLKGACLRGAMLWGVHLNESKLSGANLEGANLSKANLEGSDLRGVNLIDANLIGANLEWAKLSGAFLNGSQITRETFGQAIGEELDGDWHNAKEIYLILKNNFEQNGRYSDASWAYRKERLMEKRESWEGAGEAFKERRWRAVISNSSKAISDQLVELVCDYGEGIWRVIASLFFLWLFFAVIYGIVAGVWGPWQETANSRIRDITRNPFDLLAFSLGAMTTLQPAGLEPRPTRVMQMLMPIQALLSIVLAGLLGFVMGNRIRRS
jgi:uncharacterized protein YjbI with pentapeptide repeats